MEDLNKTIAEEISNRKNFLAEKIVELQYSHNREFWEKYGKKGKELSRRDAKYHLNFLSSALTNHKPAIFSDYIAWVKQLFMNLNFPEQALQNCLSCTEEILKNELSPESYPVIEEYIKAGIKAAQAQVRGIESFLGRNNRLAELYLNAVLKGERQAAIKLITDSLERGANIKNIYLDVIQNAQYEIGRLWQSGQISVADEHIATAITQAVLAQSYPYIIKSQEDTDKKLKIVVACIGGELHEIGARMVADIFEIEGWNAYYIGANTPQSAILQTIREVEPDLIGLSATMAFHIDGVKSTIQATRNLDVNKKPKILVGGYVFRKYPDLWKEVGADAHAHQADLAIATAEELVG